MEVQLFTPSTSPDEVRSLAERLVAGVPDAELVPDAEPALRAWLSGRGYEPAPPDVTPTPLGVEMASGPISAVVTVVLSTASAVVVETVVEVAKEWLRSLLPRPGTPERSVVLYGPDGEPLLDVRLRRDAAEPEVLQPPWPRPGS